MASTPTITTAKSQVLAVCCASIAGHPPTVVPCRTMREWARSPTLVRQWAEEWVFPLLWDAVFRLPFHEVDTRDFSVLQQHFLLVSVSLTLGVLGHSCFSCSDFKEKMCGCIGDNKVLVDAIPTVRNELISEYIIRDTTAPWDQECVPEQSLIQWAPVRFTACNRKWIVGWHDVDSMLCIHRVVRGSPVGDDVLVKCNNTVGSLVPKFTPLGDDVVILGEIDESETVEFVDLRESFNKKELVTSKKGGMKWPGSEIEITLMPESHHLMIHHHTSDLTHPSLRVLCTWAIGDWKSGLILSTSYQGGTDIEFALHYGVTGFLIGVFTLPLPANGKLVRSREFHDT